MSAKFERESLQRNALGCGYDRSISGLVFIEDGHGNARIIGSEEATVCDYVPNELKFKSRGWRFSI